MSLTRPQYDLFAMHSFDSLYTTDVLLNLPFHTIVPLYYCDF